MWTYTGCENFFSSRRYENFVDTKYHRSVFTQKKKTKKKTTNSGIVVKKQSSKAILIRTPSGVFVKANVEQKFCFHWFRSPCGILQCPQCITRHFSGTGFRRVLRAPTFTIPALQLPARNPFYSVPRRYYWCVMCFSFFIKFQVSILNELSSVCFDALFALCLHATCTFWSVLVILCLIVL